MSTLASSLRETCCCTASHLPLRVTNEERESNLSCIKTNFWRHCRGLKELQKTGPVNRQISGAVAGDSSLQDRGVAHYLLSLLFSLVSLPFCFYFCVPNQKYQKYLLLC